MISTAELAKKEFKGITLPDPYGSLLGKIPMDVSGAIWGPKGSGKSTMAVDLAYVLANELGKGIYCSSEEGPGPSMQGKIKRLGAEHPDLMVTDFEGLEDLKAAVKYSGSKFVVLDSASMGYVKLSEFEDFHDWCKDQDVMLWYILHATKDGNYKGNSMMVHMPDIEIKVCDGMAETEKNRFEETPRKMEVVFERGKREKADGKRDNPNNENIRRGIEAMQKVIKTRTDVDKAMRHPDLGWISFVWGRSGDPKRSYAGGYGVSHIIDKRNDEALNDPVFKGQNGKDVALRLPIVIEKGSVSDTYENGRKKDIEFSGYKVILRLDKDGKKKKWVLSGFRIPQNRKNPDDVGEFQTLIQHYAPEAYLDNRPQMGAGFDHSQNTKIGKKRENPADEDLLYGIEYIENPSSEIRENRAVEPDEIYQMITDMVLNTIEEIGHLPWQKEWEDTGLAAGRIATNFVSKKPYRGINAIMLNFEQKWKDGNPILVPKKFKNPYFMTFNQVEERGGKIKKGSRGYKVVYFTRLYKYENEELDVDFGTYNFDEMVEWIQENPDKILDKHKHLSAEQIASTHYIPILKYYNVFNGEDIENIDWGPLPKNDNADLSKDEKLEIGEAIYSHYPTAPEIMHRGSDAYYMPDGDYINMPYLADFSEPQFYYTTLFHEAVHSTGHESRLDRKIRNRKGSKEYAKEELVAEMGAVYLCAESGILFRTLENSAKYLHSWNSRIVKEMKKDNRFFFRAASRAQEAVDYILDRAENGVPAYRSDLKAERSNPETDTNCIVNARAKTNEGKDGIEIRFSDAPPEKVRDKLKKAGFFFYTPSGKQPFWAAKKTDERLQVAQQIAGEFGEEKRTADIEPKGKKSTDKEPSKPRAKTTAIDIPEYLLGKKTTVDFKADGSIQEQGHYAIIEVDDIIPSHNKDCSPNSRHKISKGQPRDRSLDALCNQPKFIAQNLNPTSITQGNLAFNGASTVLPDGQVIQGNGRGIALKIAKDEHPDNYKKYQQYLIDNAKDWGFTKRELERFSNPALVRIVDVPENRAIELGNVVDTSQAKMSKVDQGKAYIRNLPKDRKQAIGNLINDSSGETLGEVIDDVGMRILDQIKDLDRQGLVEDNGLTGEGKDFLRSVFAGLVFDSDENKQALQHFMNLKHTQKAGLERSYGNIIPFIDTDADITPTIQKAVEIAAQVQKTDGIDTVDDFMNQSDAFTGANADRFIDQEAQLAEFLLDQTTQKGIRDGFRMYQWKVNGKEDLFNPIDKVSPDQAFEDAFVKQLRINPDGDQVTLLPVSEFDSGEIIRDFYDTDKYEVVGTKGNNYIIKNTRTGRKENIAADVKRFVPDRSETPTMSLFEELRNNPDDALIYIGETEKITIDDGGETKGLKGEFPTFLSKNKLYIVPEYRVKEVANMVESETAIDGYEEWHNYEADETDFEIDWPAEEPALPVGTALKIWYASDKVIQPGDEKGKVNHYVHDFDSGKRPAAVKGDILIIGNVEWNERGILN